MIEPLAVGMHAANRAQVQPEDSVVILEQGVLTYDTARMPQSWRYKHYSG